MSDLPRLAVTRKEAAAICGVSVDTIAKAKNSGALKAKRLTADESKKGGRELYTLAALTSWLESLADA